MGTCNMSLLAATSYGLPIDTIHLGLNSQVFDLCAEGQSIDSTNALSNLVQSTAHGGRTSAGLGVLQG